MKKKVEFVLDDRSRASVEERDAALGHYATHQDLSKFSKRSLAESLEYWRAWYFRHDRRIDKLQAQLTTARRLISGLTHQGALRREHMTPDTRADWDAWQEVNQ